jgi:hypothetical protein
VLAVISLLIRNYTYVYWQDFKNTQLALAEEIPHELNAVAIDASPEATATRLNENDDGDHQPKIKVKRESYGRKWLKNIFSTQFLFEVILLVIHPLPGIE